MISLRFLIIAALSAGFIGQTASAQTSPTPSAFERLPSGTEYQLYRRDAAGHYQPRPLAPAGDAPYADRTGKIITMFVEYRTGKDSVLMRSRQMQATPLPFPLPPETTRGGIEEAVALLLPGDSAVFRFNADTVFSKTFRQPVPQFLRKAGNTLTIFTSARELLTSEEMQARQQKLQAEMAAKAKAMEAKLLVKDDATIQAYIKKNKLVAKKTLGGTYYVVTKASPAGMLPKKGQTVSVRYRGTVLATGKEFDSTAKHGDTPFDFTLGVGQVIQGWDQGIAALHKGSKAMLLIPSPLAYGARGAGADIPANAVLRFDVELVNVK